MWNKKKKSFPVNHWTKNMLFNHWFWLHHICVTWSRLNSGSHSKYSSPWLLDYFPQFLSISWFCLRNRIFDVTPQVFYQIMVQGLAGHSINLILLVWKKHAAHLLVCLGLPSCWNTHFKGITSSAKGNMDSSNILMYSNWSMICGM